jgi:hypothetical protein
VAQVFTELVRVSIVCDFKQNINRRLGKQTGDGGTADISNADDAFRAD